MVAIEVSSLKYRSCRLLIVCCCFIALQVQSAAGQELIFSNNFDESPTGIYSSESLTKDWNAPGFDNGVAEGRVSIVEGANAFDGKSLAVEYPTGKFGPRETGAQWKLRFGKQLENELRVGYEEVVVEYRVKFGKGFDFVRGGKLPGLIGGAGNTGSKKPTGADGWSARIHWRTGGSNGSLVNTAKANIAQYLYHVDQPNDSGEDFRWDDAADAQWCVFESDRWYHIKQRVVLNSPRMKDGIVQTWLDEKLVLNLSNIRFRNVEELKIDQLYFSTFFGGSGKKWQTSKREVAYFDDFKIFVVVPAKGK